MFHVGQKVVCVDDSVSPELRKITRGTLDGLSKGKIYTIRETGLISRIDDAPAVRIEEIVRRDKFYNDTPYWAWRFRPVVEKKTDISIFTDLLIPAKEFVNG